MGGNPSRYLYHFISKENDFDLEKTDLKAESSMDQESIINKTEKRVTYKGIIKKTNKECVAKVYIDKYNNLTYTLQDLIDDVTNFFRAKKIISIFNENNNNIKGFMKMNFITFYIGSNDNLEANDLKKLIKDKDPKKLNINNVNIIESFVPGFKPFVNGYCEVKFHDSKSIPWFLHWNWVEEKGKFLVCDIKGEIWNSNLELSSPTIQSKDKSYGNSDNGVYSLISFLADHEHTENCKNLSWPDDEHIKKIKKLKKKISLGKCENCTEYYEEIISSVFNPIQDKSPNLGFYTIITIIIILLIIVIRFLHFFAKKPIKEPEKQEEKFIEMSKGLEIIENEASP